MQRVICGSMKNGLPKVDQDNYDAAEETLKKKDLKLIN